MLHSGVQSCIVEQEGYILSSVSLCDFIVVQIPQDALEELRQLQGSTVMYAVKPSTEMSSCGMQLHVHMSLNACCVSLILQMRTVSSSRISRRHS